MNRTHRIVFNHHTGLPQVVSESARSHSKGRTGGGLGGGFVRSVLCALPLLGLASAAMAASSLPSGGVVTSGQVSISSSGSTLSVNQSSGKAAINWTSFSVGSGYTVNFNQPSASSVTLNRVVGNEQSVIDGVLNANGKVFLVNSNGILFGSGASVNVGGLVASTLNISDADFAAGNYVFAGSSAAGSVLNMGTIRAADGGYVALLGPQVANEGVIVASRGAVTLASGQKVSLNFNGDSLLSVSVDEGTLDALVANKGAIYADGGSVVLTARAADELVASQVNNSGVIQARTVEDLTGSITLDAVGGTTTVSGTLDASAPDGGNGGFIETSGDHVKVADSATITTLAPSGTSGTWLIDPDGFTVGANGDMTGAALGAALNQGSVTIASTSGSGSDGDVTVNDAVSWSGNTTLTLKATNDININNAITASGASAGLSLYYGGDYNIRTVASYAGTTTDSNGNLVAQTDTSGGVYGSVSFTACQDAASCAKTSLTINGQAYTLIGSMSQLDALDGYIASSSSGTAVTASGYYALAHDLDASGATYNGPVVTILSGTLAGFGHTVSNLTIAHIDTTTKGTTLKEGLIGTGTSTSVVRDIGILNTSITTTFSKRSTDAEAGALIGYTQGTVSHAYAENATFTFNNFLGGNSGGLIGLATNATIFSSFANVDGANGGLIQKTIGGSVQNCNATGDSLYGGLIAEAYGTLVNKSYAKGNIAGSSSSEGGLIGIYTSVAGDANSITNSFATGNVTGTYDLGGLVGYVDGTAASVTIDSTYATGNVTGYYADDVQTGDGEGGLIGYITMGGQSKSSSSSLHTLTISNAYATGNVTISGGLHNAGGLVGYIWASVRDPVYEVCCGLAGNISNSYATGTVDSSGITASTGTSTATGGLVGYSDGIGVTDSYATGNVIAGGNSHDSAGGLIGNNSDGNISNSYSSGSVTGSAGYIGGIVGTGADFTISNSYYNADNVSTGYGNSYNSGVTVTDHSQGLSSSDLNDIEYYANGTIDQVLSDRAAAAAKAAADAAAAAAAAKAKADAEAQAAAEAAAERAQAQADALARQTQATEVAGADLEEARRRGAQTAASLDAQNQLHLLVQRATPVDEQLLVIDPARFSATVKTIEVDGKLYRIDDIDEGAGK
jgi:filamentous hemagglutinin family protein